MRRVILESPYGGTPDEVEANLTYARKCLLDCLQRNEAPLASHLLYTQVLDDTVPPQRDLGIAAGLAWTPLAEATVVYTDLGISPGMMRGIERAIAAGIPVEYRRLHPWK